MEIDIQSLKESNDFLNDLYDNVTTAIFLADQTAHIQHFNDAFSALFLPSEGAIIGKLCGNAIGCCFPIDERLDCGETSNCALCALRRNIITSLTEKVPVFRDSLVRDFMIAGSRVRKYLRFTTKYSIYRAVEYVLVLVDDVTELATARIELEERNAGLSRRNARLETALRNEAARMMDRAHELERLGLERADLLREVRHRVGNNLQVISSLLSLSGGFSCGEDEAEVLRARIGIVLEVYKNAEYEAGRTVVRAGDLVHSLIAFSRITLGESLEKAEIEVEWLSLGFDRALILGFVLGEFLFFCRPGAVSPHGPASLSIFLGQREGRGQFRLEARWDADLPEAEAEASFLNLARLFAEQGEGEVDIRRDSTSAWARLEFSIDS
jgi:two-component sensor histidine kinase